MAKDTGTIRFELNRSANNRLGQCYLRLSYSLNNERSYFNTGISIYPEQWQGSKIVRPTATAVKAYQLKPADIPLQKEINDLNDRLLGLSSMIRIMEKDFRNKGKVFTKPVVIAELKDWSKSTYKDAPAAQE